jgi:HSP90 family molecular chaperone
VVKAAPLRVLPHRKGQDHLPRRLRVAHGGEQKEIYYLVGPNRAALESGPYLEGFKARNLEVLFCYEPVDEYVMSNVREFDGKKLTGADHADVKLADLPKPEGGLTADRPRTSLAQWLKDTLGERVAEVKAERPPRRTRPCSRSTPTSSCRPTCAA